MDAISSIPTAAQQKATSQFGKSLNDVNIDDFMKLMITELQNQDPLNPMDNNDILQQLSQIRDVSATEHLTDTLDAVLIGQNLSTAGALIGKEVSALTDTGSEVAGIVDRVSVEPDSGGGQRTVRIHIGSESIDLKNIRNIIDASS